MVDTHIKKISEIFLQNLQDLSDIKISGKVVAIKGLLVEANGLSSVVSIGSRCVIIKRNNEEINAEIVCFQGSSVLLMPFGSLEGIGPGCRVLYKREHAYFYPSKYWKGRIINAMAEPVDDLGALPNGDVAYKLKNQPIPANKRQPVRGKIDLGVKSINSFLSLCKGQRMGIFAGSGVGKSVLISMLARYAEADIKVIGLIGERGRELYEFVHEYLGEEGLKNCVIIVATGDEPAVIRRQAAYLTLMTAEYFRDQGSEVLCIIDSLTRFAMAQREIGLSSGEPPSTKGYTPTVFSELPQLLERAGPGVVGGGNITGLFSVLVEGDDHNEPIADAVRGILDGHIVLDRKIAERGIFPAINILQSISRTMPGCNSEEENNIIQKARSVLATYNDMSEMIRIGAYKIGSDPKVDEAIKLYPALEEFLKQKPFETAELSSCYKLLEEILQK